MAEEAERPARQRTVRAATWSTPAGADTGGGISDVLEHAMAKNWAQSAVAPQVDDGPATVLVEVIGRDRWYVYRRIRAIDTLLSRACGGGVDLVSVERLPPHTNRQPSVDARQARRAELRAARAARAQNPGHVQVHGQAE